MHGSVCHVHAVLDRERSKRKIPHAWLEHERLRIVYDPVGDYGPWPKPSQIRSVLVDRYRERTVSIPTQTKITGKSRTHGAAFECHLDALPR